MPRLRAKTRNSFVREPNQVSFAKSDAKVANYRENTAFFCNFILIFTNAARYSPHNLPG